MYKDTIAAISTAVSQSGIGIIRISGEEAFSVIDKIYCSPGGKKKLSAETFPYRSFTAISGMGRN